MFNILICCKYFIFFLTFLIVSIINIIFYKITGNCNNNLLIVLYNLINLNGCILIKFVQWILSHYKILDIENSTIIDLFSKFYENCSIHSLNYTKKIFKQEFGYEFDDVFIIDHSFSVKSGSIAQVYKANLKNKKLCNEIFNLDLSNNMSVAIKIVHPEVEYQIVFPILFFKLYKFMVSNIVLLKKYNTPFNFDSFFNNLKRQIDMTNEYKNMHYYYNYYNYYSDNPFIVIPKPIISSKNCLIMEYVHGTPFEKMDLSELKNHELITIFNLFTKNNYMFLDFIHADLHDLNWKIKRKNLDNDIADNIDYQFVIYDFGYVLENNIKITFQKLTFYIVSNNFDKLAALLYDNIINNDITLEDFSDKFNTYSKQFNLNATDNDYIKVLYKFCFDNNYYLKNNLLEIFISLILFKKYMDKYVLNKNHNKNSNFIIQQNLFSKNICKKYNIFTDMKNYIEEYFVDNDSLIENYEISKDLNDMYNDIGCDISNSSFQSFSI
jgi:predicted unusual protein kinase regulating ubiquinone biosynthesis (AarF/ABC1/UbiB family)